MAWHAQNETYLYHRLPVATVGVVWSEQNFTFYAKDSADESVMRPWRGVIKALVRARIPYVAVHADHIDRDAAKLGALVLPNLGAMTDAQVAAVRRFVRKGGGLVATGDSSLYDGMRVRRQNYALSDVFTASWLSDGNEITADPLNDAMQKVYRDQGIDQGSLRATGVDASQSYLLLDPQLRAACRRRTSGGGKCAPSSGAGGPGGYGRGVFWR